MNIKPIETIYKGYRFRSRLEARWAVFFDALGVEYEYEPEGYEFDDGTRYLPDFYLKDIQMFVEIKNEHFLKDEKNINYIKMLESFSEGTNCPILLIVGTPGDKPFSVYLSFADNNGGGLTWMDFVMIGKDKNDGKIYFFHDVFLPDFSIYSHDFDNELNLANEPAEGHLLQEDYIQAISKARQARFEFGETP